MSGLFLLSGPDRAQFNNAVTVLALLMGLYVLFNLDSLVDVTHIQELGVLHIEVLQNITPLDAGEGGLRLGLVSNNHV